MTPDIVNGIVSAAYGLTVFDHCRKLAKTGQAGGTSIFSLACGFAVCCAMATVFATSGLWASFAGNAVIMASNLTWLSMTVYFAHVKPWRHARWLEQEQFAYSRVWQTLHRQPDGTWQWNRGMPFIRGYQPLPPVNHGNNVFLVPPPVRP